MRSILQSTGQRLRKHSEEWRQRLTAVVEDTKCPQDSFCCLSEDSGHEESIYSGRHVHRVLQVISVCPIRASEIRPGAGRGVDEASSRMLSGVIRRCGRPHIQHGLTDPSNSGGWSPGPAGLCLFGFYKQKRRSDFLFTHTHMLPHTHIKVKTSAVIGRTETVHLDLRTITGIQCNFSCFSFLFSFFLTQQWLIVVS